MVSRLVHIKKKKILHCSTVEVLNIPEVTIFNYVMSQLKNRLQIKWLICRFHSLGLGLSHLLKTNLKEEMIKNRTPHIQN